MISFYIFLQIIVSVSIVLFILLQPGANSKGVLMNATSSYHTKVGLEKLAFILTIIFIIILVIDSIVLLRIS